MDPLDLFGPARPSMPSSLLPIFLLITVFWIRIGGHRIGPVFLMSHPQAPIPLPGVNVMTRLASA